MKKPVLFAVWCALLLSCSGNPSSAPERTNGYTHELKTKEDSLFQDVMDGHDAAMAKMGKLRGYMKQAIREADSLAKLKPAANAERVKSLRSLAENLQASENNMNAWMEGFTIDSVKDDKIKRIVYLESEKAKVDKVSGELLANVARADSLFHAGGARK